MIFSLKDGVDSLVNSNMFSHILWKSCVMSYFGLLFHLNWNFSILLCWAIFTLNCEFFFSIVLVNLNFFLADYLYYLHHMQLGLGSQITYLPSWWWSKGGQITPLETDHLASFAALFFFALWARFKHGIFIHSTCDIESIPILPYTQFQVICGI